MYKFVDLNERGTVSTSLSLQTIFNNNNLDEVLTDATGGFTTLSVRGRGNVRQKVNFIDVPHMDGSLESDDPVLDMREIEVRYKIKDSTNLGFRQRINRLNSLIQGSKKVLTFTDEDMLFYATLQENNIPDETSNELVCTLIFACSDPYKYGPEQPHQFTDATLLTNEGTAEAEPIFELEVLAPVTFAMVSNGEEYNLLGIPTAVDEEVVDTKTLLLSEDGSTINTWSSAGTSVDGGDVTGTMNSDDAGITVPDYGTGVRWHGPALMKEVTPTQDFEVEAHLQLRSTKPNQVARVELYLYDETMNVLGKMAIMDNRVEVFKRFGEARVGPFIGPHDNYLISSKNYAYDWDFWFGMLRMTRVGNEFEFYITRIGTNNKHVWSIKKTFKDLENKYAGKLKYVQIHIGKFGNNPRAYSGKFFSVTAYGLSQATVDQTPYIARPGDIITFDHKDDELLINGEDLKDLKDFGGSFFSLVKGENQLAVLPSGAFNAKVKYRPRYR
ncbi:hypothetical protein GLW20_01640 [Virgibacillus halodenitrificans]|nr:hypothetical protein [Virgibacillus halodenitrificans]